MANVYGNAIDLANAKKALAGLGDYTFIDTSKGYDPSKITAADVVVGGTGAVGGVKENVGTRLSGADRNSTAQALINYANTTGSQNYIDSQNKRIQDMYDAAAQGQLSALAANRDLQTSQLQRQMQERLPQFQQQRDSADVQSNMDAQRAKELMASLGAYYSGNNITQQGRIASDRLGMLKSIDTNQNDYVNDINNQIADAYAAYNNQAAQVNSQKASQIADALNQLYDAERQRKINLDQFNQQFNYQQSRDAIGDTRYNQEYKDKMAQQALENQIALSKLRASGSGSGGSKMTTAQKTSAKTSYSDMVTAYMQQGNLPAVEQAIFSNREGIIKDLGQTYYNTLEKQYNTWVKNLSPYQSANSQLQSAVYQGIDDPGTRRFINGQKVGY